MRYAIIDNSTLTAVQRLLGHIEVVNDVALDGDIAAFESLIQAILFYDTLFYVDDYKDEFKKDRRKLFPYITPIALDTFPYDKIARAAASFIDDIALRVRAGKIESDDIGKFLRELNMQSTFTWDMRSSDWFLTMKMLGGVGGIDAEKYSALNDMMFLELMSNKNTEAPRVATKYEFESSAGKTIAKAATHDGANYQISPQVLAFASSLSWLAMRTCFYTYLSNQYDADAILHPIRSAFQMSLGARLGLPSGVYKPIVQRFSDETSGVVKEIKQATDPVICEMQLPLLSAWLVNKAGSPSKAVATAFELRNEGPVREARLRLSELGAASKASDHGHFVREANRLIEEVKKAGNLLREMYAVKPKNGVSISPVIAVFNVIGKLKGLPSVPSVPLKVALPNKVLEIGLRGGFRGICRSVVQDLAAISRLGTYHEKMTAEVRFKNGQRETYLPKVEDVRFLGKRSFWKQPM